MQTRYVFFGISAALVGLVVCSGACSGGASGSVVRGQLAQEMAELRRSCQSGELTREECRELRESIWARHHGTSGGSSEGPEWYCAFAGTEGAPLHLPTRGGFAGAAEADEVVRAILYAVGLFSPNFRVLSAQVPNVAASIRRGQRFIEYNPSFLRILRRRTDNVWAVYGVMAHEIGHHLEGHTARPGGSRPDTEADADRFAGRMLGRMGASLEEAQAAVRTLIPDRGTRTHPGRAVRLAAVESGWEIGHLERLPTGVEGEGPEANHPDADHHEIESFDDTSTVPPLLLDRPHISEEGQQGQQGQQGPQLPLPPNDGSEETAPVIQFGAEDSHWGGGASRPANATDNVAQSGAAGVSASRRTTQMLVFSAECIIQERHFYIGSSGHLYDHGSGERVGSRALSELEGCAADLVCPEMRYCLREDGEIYDPEEVGEEGAEPIGECRPCGPGECRVSPSRGPGPGAREGGAQP